MKLLWAIRRRILTLLVLTGLTSMLVGQTPPPAQEEAFELSPFVVDGSTDEGYLATQTQAGTRVRAELRDMASSVSIMNAELLEDIGATDLQGALAYSVSTENEFEFAPNDGEGESTSTLIQSRTRGLVQATTSRNFFDSRLRMDTYNTERLTLARGPNSVLFGLGSPAGVIDGTLKRARIGKKTFGSVAVQFDSNSGYRALMDLNVPIRVLVDGVAKDLLAVRVGALNQDKRTFKSPESDDEQRFYATFTLRPWKGATFRGYVEDAQIHRIMGRSTLAEDYVSDWIAEGRPLYDYSTSKWTYDNGSTWESWRGTTGYPEPDITTGPNNRPVYIVDGGAPLDVSVYDSINLATNVRDRLKETGMQALSFARVPESHNTNYPTKTFSDGSIVPLDVNLNGRNSSTDFDVQVYTVTYEQKLWDNLFVEFAYNKEVFDNFFFDAFRGEKIYADVNYYIPVTNPLPNWSNNPPGFRKDLNQNWILIDNPNRGQFYNESLTIGRDQLLETETYRATISYELELTDINRWLGRYNFAGLYENETYEDFRIKTRLMSQGDERNAGEFRNGRNAILNRAYINLPGVSPATDAPSYPGAFAVPAENGHEWWDTILGAVHDDGRPELGSREVESMMGVVQAYWDGLWGDSLVAVAGYREDEVKIFDSSGEYRAPNNAEGGQVWQTDRMVLDEEPTLATTGITRTYGVVYHTPLKWLSIFYNESSNFRPITNRKDVFGELLDKQDGEGQDWGVLLESPNGKLSLRLNHFKNSANNAVENNYYYNQVKDTVITFMESNIHEALKREAVVTLGLVPDPVTKLYSDEDLARIDVYREGHPDWFTGYSPWDNQVVTLRDFTAEGWEMEVFARPVQGLDVRLTVAKTESTNSSAMPRVQEFYALRKSTWEKYYNLTTADLDDNADHTLPDWETNPLSVGWQMFNDANRMPRYFEAVGGEGMPNQLNRKWRANLIVNYRFRNDFLRGLSTGFGARWRESAAIGYLPMPNPYVDDPTSTLPDLSKPVYGEDQLFFDIWFKYQKKIHIGNHPATWTIYLKIQNPFESNPSVVPYEASYVLGGQITKYEVEANRTFFLTNTISF